MLTSTWKPEYTSRDLELWEEYQRRHDLSNQIGKVAAIDPVSGRVWIDESGADAAAQMRGEGVDVLVYLWRRREWQHERRTTVSGIVPQGGASTAAPEGSAARLL
jgi:hypothetical protein